MKYKNLLMIGLLISALGLSGCDNNQGGNSGGFKTLTPEMLDNNLLDNDNKIYSSQMPHFVLEGDFSSSSMSEVTSSSVFDAPYGSDLPSGCYLDRSYMNYGLLIFYESNSGSQYDRPTYYSMISHKMVFDGRTYYNDSYEITVTTDTNMGFFLTVRSNGYVTIYDSYGNELTRNREEEVVSSGNSVIASHAYSYVDDVLTLELDLNLADGSSLETTFVYDDNYTAVQAEDSNQPTDTYPLYEALDLSTFGLDGYYLGGNQSGSTIYVFDENNTIISSFLAPTNLYGGNVGLAIVDGKIILQSSILLPEDATSYDYSNGASKYDLLTHSYDLLGGTSSSIDLDYVLTNTVPKTMNDKNNEPTYALTTACEILDNKTLSSTKEIIIDGDGNIVDEVTGFEVLSFIKVRCGYYFNTKTKLLYDLNLNLVSDFSHTECSYVEDESSGYFILNDTRRGVSSILASSGKIIVPSVEGTLYNTVTEGSFISVTDTSVNIYTISYYNDIDAVIYSYDVNKIVNIIDNPYQTLNVQKVCDNMYISYMVDSEINRVEINVLNSSRVLHSFVSDNISASPTSYSSLKLINGREIGTVRISDYNYQDVLIIVDLY